MGVNLTNKQIPIKAMEDTEAQCRKTLLAVSATDELIVAVRIYSEKDELTDEDIESRDRLINSMYTAIRHTGLFLANAVCNSTLTRRKVYLDSCEESKVPKSAREWLMLQLTYPKSKSSISFLRL